MTNMDAAAAGRLIAKWKGVMSSEISTSQSFLVDVMRDATLERIGLNRTYDLLQRLDANVREACKGV